MAFKIPSVPPTTNKSVRFPNDMLEEIENAIRGKDCTFSAFVVAAVRAALDDLKNKKTTADAVISLYAASAAMPHSASSLLPDYRHTRLTK
ncbi:MAG: YlcI/YnfO family protein [Oscillibacter sp.]